MKKVRAGSGFPVSQTRRGCDMNFWEWPTRGRAVQVTIPSMEL